MNRNQPPKNNNNGFNNFKSIPFIGSLRTIELVGIGLLLLAGLMYGVSKCSRSKTETKKDKITNADKTGGSDSTINENDEKVNALRRRLYVTMDSLKMRKGPHKDSALAKVLPYGDELIDMGEYQNEQTIRISADYLATEPWIKVRTKEGMTGWVFGGGVRPYPKKKPEPKKVTTEKKSESEEKNAKEKSDDSGTKTTKTDTKAKEDKKSKTTKKDSKKDS